MTSYELEDLIDDLAGQLEEEFPDDGFLIAELDAVIQGVFMHLRWKALRQMIENEDNRDSAIKEYSLAPHDHFTDDDDDRQELIDRIMHTSGLNRDVSDYCLETIEKLIDKRLTYDDTLDIEGLGVICAPEPPGYMIELTSTALGSRSSGSAASA